MFITLLMGISCVAAKEPPRPDYPGKDQVLTLLVKVADWQNSHLGHLPEYGPLGWQYAAYFTGLMELQKITGNEDYFSLMYDLGRKYNWSTVSKVYDADYLAVGQMYLDIYMQNKDTSVIRHLRWVLDSHLSRKALPDVRFAGNNYRREWWSWCDALFMGPPTFAKMYQATGEQKYLDYAVDKWLLTTDYLWDSEENLVYRDDRYFDKRSPVGRKVFWSRGNGWVFAALARMLEIIPAENQKKTLFTDQFRKMASKLVTIQGDDGLWRPDLLDPEDIPQPETSGTAFFCYGLLWGVANGILTEPLYETAALKAWYGLVKQVDENGRVGNVQPPGAEPKPYGPDEWQEYGTGAFLFAGTQLYRMIGEGHRPGAAGYR